MERLLSSGIEVEQVEPVNELEELREQLADLREEFTQFRVGIERDRNQIGSMLHALRAALNGDAAQSAQPNVASQPIPEGAYRAWKERLPPACGRVIDALLIQPMSYAQLKNFCKMGASTLDGALAKLRANSLIDKDGSLNRLKRL